jgi:hypothetical protein
MSLNECHSEIKHIMMLAGFTYLAKFITIPSHPIEIIFSRWECLPTNIQISPHGVKLYYNLNNDENKYGSFAEENNLKFYKDYK